MSDPDELARDLALLAEFDRLAAAYEASKKTLPESVPYLNARGALAERALRRFPELARELDGLRRGGSR